MGGRIRSCWDKLGITGHSKEDGGSKPAWPCEMFSQKKEREGRRKEGRREETARGVDLILKHGMFRGVNEFREGVSCRLSR